MLTQQQLMDRSQRTLQEVQRDPSLTKDSQRLKLRKESEDLKSQIASRGMGNAPALQDQLSAVEARLQRLESQGTVAQTIIQSYEPSVCLIHVVVGFRDHTTQLPLHYAGITSTSFVTTS